MREGRRVLNMGRVASEQVDDGQLRSAQARGGTSILEDSWGSKGPWKKKKE